VVASKVITLSELDKTVPPETKDTDIVNISDLYETEIVKYIRKALGQ
jgi:hypothetical protein